MVYLRFFILHTDQTYVYVYNKIAHEQDNFISVIQNKAIG